MNRRRGFHLYDSTVAIQWIVLFAVNRRSLAFSAYVIYTFERQYGVIGLFTGKRRNGKRSSAHRESGDATVVRSTLSGIGNDTILLKSPRGREEIETRAHGLASLARRLLIMADGRHTVSDLARELACNPGDPTLLETLQRLVDGRYLHISDDYDRRGHGRRATA